MKIKITQEVNVSLTPYCRNCFRREADKNGRMICTLFNRYLNLRKGDYLKCRECYEALYDAIDRIDREGWR